MTILNQGTLTTSSIYLEAATAHEKLFFDTIEQFGVPEWMMIAKRTLARKKGDYHWLGELPILEKFVDTVHFSKLKANGFTLINVPYTGGIEIDKDDFQQDALGLIQPRVEGMADAANRIQVNTLTDVINAGLATTYGTAYDGGAFFAAHTTTHNATYTNYYNVALSIDALAVAWTRMVQQKDPAGNKLNVMPDTLFVGPDRFPTAKLIYEGKMSGSITGGSSATDTLKANTGFEGMFKPVLIPYLTATYWILADMSKPMKPFIIQEMPPEAQPQQEIGAMIWTWFKNGVQFIVDLTDLGKTRKVNYGAESNFAIGYGLPQLALLGYE